MSVDGILAMAYVTDTTIQIECQCCEGLMEAALGDAEREVKALLATGWVYTEADGWWCPSCWENCRD